MLELREDRKIDGRKEEGLRRRKATEQKRKTSEQIQSEKDGSGDQTQRRWRIS